MGFWDTLGEVASVVLEKGAQRQEEIQRRAGKQVKDYERKIVDAEKSDRMSNPAYARKVNEAKQKLASTKVKMYTGDECASNIVKVDSNGQVIIGEKTIDSWESQWRSLGILSSLKLDDLSSYNNSIGLYKAEMCGKIYYIGRAIEYDNGGFRKRLRDYVRDSDSARTHKSGGKMNENADSVHISILVMGSREKDVDAVKALEKALVRKYVPQWNVQFNR